MKCLGRHCLSVSRANRLICFFSLHFLTERETLIRELPGGYAELLSQLLNPNAVSNWEQLAYEFGLTLSQVANLRENPNRVQDLLLHVGTRNATVDMLWRALKNIKRDDACVTLINWILEQRKDNESRILLIH